MVPIASHDAVAGNQLLVHAKIVAAMLDEHVPFFKRAGIEQQFNPLARRQLPFGVLCVDPPLTAAEFRCGTFLFELPNDLFHQIFSLVDQTSV